MELDEFAKRGMAAQQAVDALTRPRLVCFRCGKGPKEISEYREAAFDADCTPEDFVWTDEGTLNHATGRFACTACYIAAGMPVSDGKRWTAP